MPGYVKKQLVKYNHPKPKKPQHCPWEPNPTKYGSKTQEALPVDDSPPLDEKGIKQIQQIVGSFLYYCRATDPTIPHALNELSSQQSKATENTLKRCRQFMDYMWTHPDATIRYYPSEMILNVHLDASYLAAAQTQKAEQQEYFSSVPSPETNNPSTSTAHSTSSES